MPSYTYHPVAAVDFGAFTDAFNFAYSDYFVPISMTPEALSALMERDDLSRELSVAALDGDMIVGTGLLGVRPPLGWIGGMGVIPAYRRQGIARQMMAYLLRRARERRLDRIALEVIEANTGAHTLYREMGFEHLRYLLVLEREPSHFTSPVVPHLVIEEVPANVILNFYDAFHDIPNCWQRSRPSLVGLVDHAQSWVARRQNVIVGYALGWANGFGIRLLDLATDPHCDRVSVALALLDHLHRHHPHAYASSYNIAEDDPLLPAFTTAGYVTSFRQIEMFRDV